MSITELVVTCLPRRSRGMASAMKVLIRSRPSWLLSMTWKTAFGVNRSAKSSKRPSSRNWQYSASVRRMSSSSAMGKDRIREVPEAVEGLTRSGPRRDEQPVDAGLFEAGHVLRRPDRTAHADLQRGCVPSQRRQAFDGLEHRLGGVVEPDPPVAVLRGTPQGAGRFATY